MTGAKSAEFTLAAIRELIADGLLVDSLSTALLDALAVPRSAFGEVLTAALSPQAAWRFDYGVNTRIIATTGTANGGTVTASASRAMLSTSAAANGIARIQSKAALRYLPGMGGLARFTAVFAAPTTGSQQLIGVGDTTDGLFFGYDGAQFGIMRRYGGSDTWTYAANWNGEKLSATLNPQTGNIYQIRFQWLGYGILYFYVFDWLTRTYVNVHRILYPNTSVLTSLLNPTLPLFAEIKNAGNTTDLVLYTPSALAAVEGVPQPPTHPLDIRNSFDAILTAADTNNNQIATIHNKTAFGGVANRVPLALTSIGLSRSASGATNSILRLYRNATFSGVLTYTDIDTANSPVEASATAATITGGSPERSFTLTDVVTARAVSFVPPDEFLLYPDDTLTIAQENTGVQSTLFIVTLNWAERF